MDIFYVGVVAVSWYPSGQNDDEGLPPDRLMPAILDAADKYDLKVAIQCNSDILNQQSLLRPTMKRLN